MGFIIAIGMMGGLVKAAGPCSNYPKSCSPPCNKYCTYYTFEPGSITKTIKQIPFELSAFRPGGTYCDLEAEDQLSETMKQLPYKLGRHNIKIMPIDVTLKYTIAKPHEAGPGSCGCGGGMGDGDGDQEYCESYNF